MNDLTRSGPKNETQVGNARSSRPSS